MALIYIGLLVLAAAVPATVLFFTRVRLLDVATLSNGPLPDVERYRPMLRLLSDADLGFASSSPKLRGKIRARRRETFRGYLRCLTKDYARLLAGVRHVMVESGVDRPDLAKALAKNRMMFAYSLCQIELYLQLHTLGIGTVDVSSLVEALDALRGAVAVMTPVMGGAY